MFALALAVGATLAPTGRAGGGPGYDAGTSVAIQPDGKIVVAGSSHQGASKGIDFAIARYMPNGSLDPSFAGDGRRTTGFGNGAANDLANDVAIQANGRIVAVGESYQGATERDFAVARFMPDGSLDSSFAGDGKRTTTVGPDDNIGEGVAIQPNGRILVAGSADLDPGAGLDNNFAIARYLPNGGPDQSFAGDGKRTTTFGPANDGGTGVLIQPNGRIVVAGHSDQGGTGTDFAIARYLSDGSLDQSFAGDGKRLTVFGASADVGNDVAIQPNGRLVMAGESFQSGSADFAVARYLPNGGLDQSFAGDGKRKTTFGPANDRGTGVLIQPNGRIVVPGRSDQPGTSTDFAIARYLSDGSLDQSFAGDGKRTTTFGTNQDFGRDVALQPNGRIVVAGESDRGAPGYDFAIARYLVNGGLDQSFSGNGKQTTAF